MLTTKVFNCIKLRFEHLLTILLASSLAFCLIIPAHAQEILKFNPAPYEENGTVMVPMRVIFEWLGAEITYQDGLITAVAGETTIQIRVGEKKAMVGETEIILTNAAVMKKDTTFVPLRFVSEALGAQIEYDSAVGKITLRKDNKTGIVRLPTPQETWPYNYNKLLSFALKEEKLGDKAKESGDNKSARSHYEIALIALNRIHSEEAARYPLVRAQEYLLKRDYDTIEKLLLEAAGGKSGGKYTPGNLKARERVAKSDAILYRIKDKIPKEEKTEEPITEKEASK